MAVSCRGTFAVDTQLHTPRIIVDRRAAAKLRHGQPRAATAACEKSRQRKAYGTKGKVMLRQARGLGALAGAQSARRMRG